MANKTRFAQLCIDIGESTVKIIKINRNGTITRAGHANIAPSGEGATERERLRNVSAAVKKAAKSARINGGACTVVTGGPHIIVRRFSWPDMPYDALRINAETEIEPYLPAGDEQFQISCRIIRKTTAPSADTGNLVTKLDVLVSAMAKNDAVQLRTAVKKAGFSVKRIDIRENAREKLVEYKQLWSEYRIHAGNLGVHRKRGAFTPSGSFVILDLADALVNMTVFISGRFYANRYFGTYLTGSFNDDNHSDSDESDESDFAENLAAEAVSVIDYVHYQERGSQVRSVLLLGDGETAEDFTKSFGDSLDVPVISESAVFSHLIFSKRLRKRTDISAVHFLDAFGAAIITPGKPDSDLDLRYIKTKKTAKYAAIVIITTLILAVPLFAAFYIPEHIISGLETELRYLADEYPVDDISKSDVLTLRLEVEGARLLDAELSEFHTKYPSALWVLNTIYDALPSQTGISVTRITYGTITLSGTAAGFRSVADFIDNLRRSGVFGDNIIHTVGNIPRGGESSMLGHRVKTIETAYEDGAVDFEMTLTILKSLEVPQ